MKSVPTSTPSSNITMEEAVQSVEKIHGMTEPRKQLSIEEVKA